MCVCGEVIKTIIPTQYDLGSETSHDLSTVSHDLSTMSHDHSSCHMIIVQCHMISVQYLSTEINRGQ